MTQDLSLCFFQVIVMSSHETIRVLEVGVDAPLPAEEEEGKTLETMTAPPGEVLCRPESLTLFPLPPGEAKPLPGIAPVPVPVPAITTFSQVPAQPTQTLTPIAVQATPQVKWPVSRGWLCGHFLQQRLPPSQD
uniref:Uncharacterized protein n=1 Tax=Sphenodon punctatus TaxID=8508 RepID=A0A8D0L587_SPHPU